jgi:hypothetical protein
MSKLSVDNNGQIRVVGKEKPIDTHFNVELAEALLRSPPFGANSIADILGRLTEKSRKSLDILIEMDDTLSAQVKVIHSSFPVLFEKNKPKDRIKPEDVLEEIFVDCNPIMMLIFTVDGECFVSPRVDDYVNVYTFDEFEKKYARSVEDHLDNVAKVKIDNLSRVLRLVHAKAMAYNVCLTTDSAVLPERIIKVYSREQIELYARRLRMTVMSCDAVN